MRLTLDALAVLDAIDRRGSFAAAAGELHRVRDGADAPARGTTRTAH